MTNDQPDFYLASTESSALGEPRKAWRVKRLRGDDRDDYLLIRIDPPIIGQPFGLGAKDINMVIVAPRHEGVSLFPIVEWPVFVYVARPLIDDIERRGLIHGDDTTVIYWAELYKTEEDALNKAM